MAEFIYNYKGFVLQTAVSDDEHTAVSIQKDGIEQHKTEAPDKKTALKLAREWIVQQSE